MSRLSQYIKKVAKLYRSIFYRRDSKTIVFGAWFGEKFADNPKYLYLEALRHRELNPIWMTKNIDVYYDLSDKGFPVVLENTAECNRALKQAKYFVTCTGNNDVDAGYLGGATIINLWHGIPLKKIMWADKYNSANFFIYVLRAVLMFLPLHKEFVVSTSETIQQIYEYSFRKNKKHIPILGQPRNDLFFLDIFPESKNIKKYENQKVITYMPTHRNEGATPLEIERWIDLDKIDAICKKYGFLFLIKRHFYHKNERLNDECYSNIFDITNEDVDAQDLLKYTDILITDYSSCYIDFLLLDRPIIYFAFDYEHYLANDREMYFDYETAIAGPIVKTSNELLKAIEDAILRPDLQYEKRQKVKSLFYDKDSSGPCGEKILEFMMALK